MQDEREDEAAPIPGPASEGGSSGSVLEVIRRKLGETPRVSLEEDDPAQTASPVIDPRTDERQSLPKGRGNYQILGEIARGGMGIVLKGHDTDLGRDVALKVLNRDFVDRPEVLQRFVEEAQVGGQLQHPGIVPVYELGLMADERPYFTMKLVKGRTLATLLAERETPKSERRRMLDVFESVCQTMAYAHSRGVIHRDLKPANVMVGAFGEVQVVDWGLAKVMARGGRADERRAKEMRTVETILSTVRSDGSSTGSDSLVGSVMGTPAYMPPEQASGLVDRLDERSDVFSLGAILCEILTGAPPYTGDTEEIVARAAQGELDDAQARLEGCGADPALVKLTRQCLTPAPAARPRNAGVLADRIHQHIVSLEERALAAQIEAAEARVHAEEERRARRLTFALAAAVVGIVLAGGGGYLRVQSEKAGRARREAAFELARLEQEAELRAEVEGVLDEASALGDRESYAEALLAVERAAGLVEAGDAGESLRGRVESVRSRIEGDVDEAEGRAETERRRREFLASLQAIERGDSVGEEGGASRGIDWRGVEGAYAALFRSRGVDVDTMEPEAVAEALAEFGPSQELVLALHWWIAARRETSRLEAESAGRDEDLGPALRLVEVAHLLDDDPLRSDLREAMLNDDVDMLRFLAEGDLADQPAPTLALLSSALALNGEREVAVRLLRSALHQHPDEYYLHAALIKLLTARVNSSFRFALEAVEAVDGAIALRPDDLALRGSTLWTRFNLGRYMENKGHEVLRRRAFEDFVDEAEALLGRGLDIGPPDHDRIGESLWRLGEWELAVSRYRRGIRAHPDARVLHEGLGWTLRQLGRFEEAERALVRATELEPDYSRAFQELAAAHGIARASEGDLAAAEAALEAVIEVHPDPRPTARNNVAYRFAVVPRARLLGLAAPAPPPDGEVDRALAGLVEYALHLADLAVEEEAHAAFLNTRGCLRLRTGDPEGCLEDLARSMSASEEGGDPADFFFAAMAHHELGDEETALRYYERGDLWLQRNWLSVRYTNAEFVVLRAEVAELLGAR